MSGNSRLTGMIYYALAGASLGLALAVAFERWVWLDMRFNTGLLMPVAVLAGITAGCIRKKIDLFTGFTCLLVFILMLLTVARGNLYFISIVLGATFRDGIFLPDLPLKIADISVLFLLLVSFVVFVCFRRGGKISKNV
jgi:hypothetical protein